MKRRQTDEHDRISDAEIKQARIPWWKAIKLFLTNLPMIYKIVVLVIAAVSGTIAAPQIAQQVSEIAGGDTTIPEGTTTAPQPNAVLQVWQGDVNTALTSQKNAIDGHTGELEALREELRELEARVSAQRARGDSNVSARVSANENEIEILKGIVQP